MSSPLYNIRTVAAIPTLGTGKTDYRKLKELLAAALEIKRNTRKSTLLSPRG